MGNTFDPTTPLSQLPFVELDDIDHLLGVKGGQVVRVGVPTPVPPPPAKPAVPVRKAPAKRASASKKGDD